MTTHKVQPIFITHITSNVKKGVDTSLGKRTLVVGPNGAGKTSIVNSIELAMGAFATDVMGRQAIKKPGDLMVLSQDGKTLQAVATLSDGSTASFETQKTRTGAKRPKHVNAGSVAFPFMDVIANLTGSAAKARTWFLQRIGADLQFEAVAQCFSVPMERAYRESAFSRSQKADNQVDLLIAVADESAKKGRAARTEAQVLHRLREEKGNRQSELPPTDQKIVELREAETEAMQAYNAYSSQGGATPEMAEQARIQATQTVLVLKEHEKEYEGLLKEYNSLDHTSSDGSQQNWKLVEIRRTLLPSIELHAKMGLAQCLVCEQGQADFARRRDTLKEANAKSDRIFKLTDQMGEYRNKIASQRENAQGAIDRWQQMEKNKVETCPQKAESFRLHHQQMVDQRLRAQQARAEWKDLNQLTDRIAEKEEQEKAAKDLAKACQNVIKRLLQASIKQFEEKVCAYLPGDEAFGLEVDQKSDSCRFGIRRGTRLISALSGAEWARVITAIGCATVNGAELSLFMPEERAFDPDTLCGVMDALSTAPGQVVLTSTVRPTQDNSDWTIIDLSSS